MNDKLPELIKLEELIGQYDFLIQEGVFYTQEEKDEAYFLLGKLSNLIDEMLVRNNPNDFSPLTKIIK